MVTRAEVDAYSEVIDGLSAVAFAQVKALLASLDNPNPITFRDALIRTYPELMRPFMSAASDVAAEWYTTLRLNAGVRGAFRPLIAPTPVDDQFDAIVRYSLTPLFSTSSSSTVLNLLAGATQKLIANQGRNTISGSAFSDSVRVGFARIPRAGCCAFCGMLASRGAVYSSAAAAGGVSGRGVDASATAGKRGGQGQGVKARGSRALGSSDYHSNCRCVGAPVFVGDTLAKETRLKYTAMYDEAFEVNERGAISTRDTLANWRKVHGTK